MKNWKVLTDEAEYKKALDRTIIIFHAGPGTPEFEELKLLVTLVKNCEERHIQVHKPQRLVSSKMGTALDARIRISK